MTIPTEVILRAQQGDNDAFDEMIGEYRQRVFGTIYRLIGRPDEVEDVGQEVFLRIYVSLGQLREISFFDTWLYRVTVNAVYDHLRRRRRSTHIPMADVSDEQILAADAAESDKRYSRDTNRAQAHEQLSALLSEISAADRDILTRKEIWGLSLKELQSIYNANENAIKVRLFRARRRAFEAHERLAAGAAN